MPPAPVLEDDAKGEGLRIASVLAREPRIVVVRLGTRPGEPS
jgi:hypothetical protein